MPDLLEVAAVAFLMGDATRSRMLTLLMSGEARTATELAAEGGVGASTASSHLALMVEAGLVAVAKQGRYRYFRLARPEVAFALESLMSIAPTDDAYRMRVGPRDEALRAARVCYDHLAGTAAVRLLQTMRDHRYLQEDGTMLTASGEQWCVQIGIDVAALRKGRRQLCRPCMDWSERRDHLAGALGAALLQHLFALGYVRRVPDQRTVRLAPEGNRFIATLL